MLELGLSVSPIQNGLCLFPQGRALLMAFILLSFLLFHHFCLIYGPRGTPWIRKKRKRKKKALTDAHKVFKLEKQYSKYSSTCGSSEDMFHILYKSVQPNTAQRNNSNHPIVFISLTSHSYVCGPVEGKITLLADHQFILHTIFLPFSSCDILLLSETTGQFPPDR